jgi:protein arginine kinase activator
MLCQNCQKRLANVHLTQIINNSKVEMFLCEQCARDKGQPDTGMPLNINDFFSGLIGYNSIPHKAQVIQKPVCEKCGLSFEEFQRIGKIGCENCYTVYGDRLEPIIKRLHGNIEHRGKVTEKESQSMRVSLEIKKLKSELSKAVQSEEYEKAAEIRDKIRNLEVTGNSG